MGIDVSRRGFSGAETLRGSAVSQRWEHGSNHALGLCTGARRGRRVRGFGTAARAECRNWRRWKFSRGNVGY